MDSAGVQEDQAESSGKKKMQRDDDGFGREAEAVQEFT
jgi:hypothetical protein